MARSLSSLRDAVRQRASMEAPSQVVTDAELDSYINGSLAELHDLLVTTYEDYYTTFTTFSLTSASNVQVLPTDFHKLRRLQFATDGAGGAQWMKVPAASMEDMERPNAAYRTMIGAGRYRSYRVFQNGLFILPEDDASGTYRLWYVQVFQPLLVPADETGDWQGWTEYAVVDAAIKCLMKEESDVSTLGILKMDLKRRIEAAAQNRDAAEPQHFADVTSHGTGDGLWR